MRQFLVRRGWIGVLVGIILLLVPNSILRAWLPVADTLPAPTEAATADPTELSYQQALELAASDPLTALPTLNRIAFNAIPDAESARTLAHAIEAARLVDDPAYTLTASGQALAAIGEWRLAQKAFLKAVQLDPHYAEAWAYLGEAQQENGEDGYPALQRAMKLNPNSIAVQLFAALYWQRQQNYDLAGTHYLFAAALDPQNAAIQLQWGQNSMLAGDVSDARRHFENAAALSPDDLQVWLSVARFCMDSELFVGEMGLPAALRLLKAEPDNAEAIVLVGRAFSLAGDQVVAGVYLARAAELHPDFMLAHYYFALFLLASEDRAEAIRQLNQVIALAPLSPEAHRAAELIVKYSQ